MVNPNKKVKRPDGLGKIYKYKTDENENILTLPISELLKENYIYIYRAINKENFYITPDDSCFFFKEIIYENEVVGFATYRPSNINESSLVMQYIYILPDYRGKDLLVEEIDEAASLFESSILIEYPSRAIVDVLIKHKLARVFNNRFVISRIPFIIPMVSLSDANSKVVREEFDMTDKKGYSKLSLVYDLDLCAVIGLASSDIENMYTEDVTEDDDLNNYNTMSLPLRVDNEKFNCIEKRENESMIQDETYFKKVREIVDSQDEIIQNWLTIL